MAFSLENEHYLKIKQLFDRIRNARNEIFHNKPTKIKFQKDIEILLLRFGYNLFDATQIIDIQRFIKLKFIYKESK